MVYPALLIVAFILVLCWIYWPDKDGVSNVTYKRIPWWPTKHNRKNTKE